MTPFHQLDFVIGGVVTQFQVGGNSTLKKPTDSCFQNKSTADSITKLSIKKQYSKMKSGAKRVYVII